MDDALKSIQWNVLLIIASSFGISKAIVNSGLAGFIADNLIMALGGAGIIGLLIGIYCLTSVYTEMITNNAAAAFMFPIAITTAAHVGINPRPFAIAVAIAASASFATPIGYQTNLMVYGPGGYKYSDYLKVGLPLQLIVVF